MPSERGPRADAHRSLEEVLYQLGDLDLPYISPSSPLDLQVLYQLGDLYLPYISPTSPLDLP